MKSFEIPYSSTNQFSKLVIDYLNEGLELKPFISHFPRLENFEKQIVEKQSHKINRKVLVEILRKQNSNLSLSEQSRRNIKRFLLTYSKTIPFLLNSSLTSFGQTLE